MRRNLRRLVTMIVAIPLLGLLVLVVEVLVARSGQKLPESEPFQLDATVGGDGGDPLQIAWLGDSTAAGVGASTAANALPWVVADRLALLMDRPVAVQSLAISGARVEDVLEAQVRGLSAGTDIVVIDVGSNDVTHLTSVRTFQSRYSEVLSLLPPDVEVVLLGVPDMGAPPRLAQPLRYVAGVRGGTLDKAVHELAESGLLRYVDIAGETGAPFRSDSERYFAADGYHPNDAGYRLWANAAMPAIAAAAREVVG